MFCLAALAADNAAAADGFIVTFYHVGDSIGSQTFNISVENPADSKMNADLGVIIEPLNFDAALINDMEMFEWELKERTYQVPVYNVTAVEITQPNGTYEVNVTQITGYDNVTVSAYEWSETRLASVNKTTGLIHADAKEINIGKHETKWFRLIVKTPIAKTGDGWGSAGVTKLKINDTVYVDMVNSSWWNSSWSYCRDWNITNASIAAGINNTIAWHFINDTNFDYSHANADGSDLVYVSAPCSEGGTQLAHTIERWNATGESRVAVNVNVSASPVTNISYYYGYASAVASSDPAATWSNGYYAVWLLNETSGTFADQLGNWNGEAYGDIIYNYTGQIDGAVDIDDAVLQQRINLTDRDISAESFTVEAWVNLDDITQRNWILSKYDPGPVDGDDYYFEVTDGGAIRTIIYESATAYALVYTGAINPAAGTWHHITTVNHFNVKYYVSIFINGTARSITQDEGAGGANSVQNSSVHMFIGGAQGSQDYDGKLDYVTFSYANRSADWVLFQYQAGINNVSIFGTEQSAPSAEAVTLNAPADASTNTTQSVWFNYTPSGYSGFTNCSLYHNATGTWGNESLNASAVTNGASNYILDTVADGNVTWNIECCNSGSPPVCTFAAANFTLQIESTPPVCNGLLQVGDDTTSTDGWFSWLPISANMSIVYNISEDADCSMRRLDLNYSDMMNDPLAVNCTTVQNGTTYNVTCYEKYYRRTRAVNITRYISCNDSYGNEHNTTNNCNLDTFTVRYRSPAGYYGYAAAGVAGAAAAYIIYRRRRRR